MPLTARDVMTSPVTTVTPSTPLAELARLLTEDQISGVPVVDVESRLVGIVSKTDLLERLIDEATDFTSNPSFRKLFNLSEDEDTGPSGSTSDEELDWMPEMVESTESANLGSVEDIMEPEVITVAPNAPITQLAAIMSRDRIHRVVVVDGKRVLGIVTSLDLLGRFPSATASAPKRAAASSTTAKTATRSAPPKAAAKTKTLKKKPAKRTKSKVAPRAKTGARPTKRKAAARR